FCLLKLHQPPRSTLFPYTTLFRSDLTNVTTSADLSFKLSHDTEPNYDFVFVEAHTVGQDDWTTLPDANGNTADDVGLSCDINWEDRKSTRLNSSHEWISYAVFCLK